jgi:threonine aldolase
LRAIVKHLFEVPDAATVVARCRDEGVLIGALDARHARAVTHLDIDDAGVEQAGKVLGAVLASDG